MVAAVCSAIVQLRCHVVTRTSSNVYVYRRCYITLSLSTLILYACVRYHRHLFQLVKSSHICRKAAAVMYCLQKWKLYREKLICKEIKGVDVTSIEMLMF